MELEKKVQNKMDREKKNGWRFSKGEKKKKKKDYF
jgi:hypothetical protein